MKVIVNPVVEQWAELCKRGAAEQSDAVRQSVAKILARVKDNGDQALVELTREIDNIELKNIRVGNQEIAEAQEHIDPTLKTAIVEAAENIRKFHSAQRYEGIDMNTTEGVRCTQRSVPISKVGLYIPGGTAPLFSTVLMLAIPAQVAGCKEIILCTPPSADGEVNPKILYAASMCGITHIYRVGGAQAIGAMAFGTGIIPKVDKIFGPGNRYVTEAKQQVSVANVAIDMPAGPSEVMIMADESAKAEFVAADLLSQAEHGSDSQGVVVTNSCSMAHKIEEQVQIQTELLSRGQAVRKALENSRIVVFDTKDDMIEFANFYAAEHLIISMDEPWSIAEQITAAGSVFIGNFSPESAGDYASGTNHTLPTSGWAKAYSGVNLDSFCRKITYQELSSKGLKNLGQTIMTMAMAEGLDAHSRAVEVRLREIDKRR